MSRDWMTELAKALKNEPNAYEVFIDALLDEGYTKLEAMNTIEELLKRIVERAEEE